MFNQPNTGAGFFKPAEAHGHLILVLRVHGTVRRYDDLRKDEVDQFTVDLVDLDTHPADVRERVILAHPGITNKLTPDSTMVLGRIGQVRVGGDKTAWVLEPYNVGVDDVRAEQWVMANQARPRFDNGQRPPAQQAPAPQYQQQAPPPAQQYQQAPQYAQQTPPPVQQYAPPPQQQYAPPAPQQQYARQPQGVPPGVDPETGEILTPGPTAPTAAELANNPAARALLAQLQGGTAPQAPEPPY